MYRKMLVAVDLSDTSDRIIGRAKELADELGAAIRLLHVSEYIPVEPMEPMGEAVLPAVDIERDLIDRASEKLDGIAAKHGLADAPRSVEIGSVKGEIVRVAKEESCDLVVLGSRERHGLSILVNATEDTVLHKAKCDVLAVRIG